MRTHGWSGLGQGWGQLTARQVSVTTTGRGLGRPLTADLLLPGPTGTATTPDDDVQLRPVPVTPAPLAAAAC